MGKTTLEVFDERQAQTIDQIEVGHHISGQIHLALPVPDLDAALEQPVEHGATLVHPPVETPWGGFNARIQHPDGMRITLSQAPN
jgi:predicted enzyme related to lactoylglutathione lyase